MAIKCPYCSFAIELKGVRAGHFQPKCPRCSEKFGLVVHTDPNMQPTVTALHDPLGADVAAALGITQSKPPVTAKPKQATVQATMPPATAQTMAPAHVTAPPVSQAPHHAPQHAPRTSMDATMPPVQHAGHGDRVSGHGPSQDMRTSAQEPRLGSNHASHPGTGHSGGNHSQVDHLSASPAAGIGATSVPRAAAPVLESPPAAPHDPQAPEPDVAPGTTLGGYEVIQKLGAGGMGAVYLARQVSLDRNIALKTLHPQLAKDPQLVSRFTREAYAAAQLTHHNIVQIHDIGQDKDINFFSMEFVSGHTLSNALREAGKLDTETAVSYVLQAARGLKFAHDHGLIHRDIKPENLLLNDQGIVKVADLGLVKRVGSHETENMQMAAAERSGVAITQVNKSMGTPLYMPPEQAVDAARVDHRADIYSLGCTLYHMVTGRPPFIGRTAMEVITKHQNEPLTPPDVVVKDCPAALSPIIGRMLAKRPDDRYAAMKDVIAALEGFLGVASAGPYTPKDDQVKILEFAVDRYNNSLWARLRPKLILAFYAACALLAVLFAYTAESIVWKINFAGGMIGLALLTTVAYQVTVGIMRGTHLFRKVRQLVFGAGITDWLLWIVGIAIFGYAVYAFGLWGPWLFAAVVAVMLSQAFYWTIDNMAARDRETYLRQAEHLIKQMRLKGLDENAIRQFVCKFSGRHWEEFFENLFGYEAKLQARQIWGKERGKDRPKHAGWREPLINFIDYRIESRKQIKEAKLLAKLEAKALQAKGIDEKLARKQASKNAERLVSSAEVLKRESEKAVAATLAPPSAKQTAGSPGVKETAPDLSSSTMAMSFITAGGAGGGTGGGKEEEYAPEYVKQSYLRRRYGTPVQMLTSSMIRFAMGLVLLTVYANWWNLNFGPSAISAVNEVTTTHQRDAVDALKDKDFKGAIADIQATEATKAGRARPLEIQLVPARLTHPILPTSVLIAGVLLAIGAAFRGRMLGIAMYLSAGMTLMGYLFPIPFVVGNWFMAALVGLGIWVFSVIFLRVKVD